MLIQRSDLWKTWYAVDDDRNVKGVLVNDTDNRRLDMPEIVEEMPLVTERETILNTEESKIESVMPDPAEIKVNRTLPDWWRLSGAFMQELGNSVIVMLDEEDVVDSLEQAQWLVWSVHARASKLWSVDLHNRTYTVGSGRMAGAKQVEHVIREVKAGKLQCSNLCQYSRSSCCPHRLVVWLMHVIEGQFFETWQFETHVYCQVDGPWLICGTLSVR